MFLDNVDNVRRTKKEESVNLLIMVEEGKIKADNPKRALCDYYSAAAIQIVKSEIRRQG